MTTTEGCSYTYEDIGFRVVADGDHGAKRKDTATPTRQIERIDRD